MTAARRPNILLLLPDQHRFDWLGCAGGFDVRTPGLDALAERGTRFTRAVCPSPLCAPSRACLAAGVEFDRCETPDNGVDFPPAKTTFYRRLRDGGYRVMGCGKFDLAKAARDWDLDGKRRLTEWGFSDGIDSEGKWDGVSSGADRPRGPYLAYLERRGLRQAHLADFDRRRGDVAATFPTPLDDQAYCDNWVAANGLTLLGDTPPGGPWFLQVNFTGPHDPWDVTASMAETVRDRDLPPPSRLGPLTAADHVRIRRNYTAMVENIDRWVGAYVDLLRGRGELDETLIVYTSDHGEMLGDRERFGKSMPYQPSLCVPLIVAGPGVAAGEVHDGPATIMDLAATFLDAAGVDRPAQMDSRSMMPLLTGRSATHRDVVVSGLGRWRLALDGRYKLIRGFAAADLLYDLAADPLETRNIAAEQPDVVRRLSRFDE